MRGRTLCSGLTRRGRPCFCWAIEPFDRCLHHIDEADLPMAEAIAGFRRCTRPGCLMYATSGSLAVKCKIHGGLNVGSVQWKWAKMRVRERRLRAKARLGPAPSPERISAALLSVEAEVGRYKPPRETEQGVA